MNCVILSLDGEKKRYFKSRKTLYKCWRAENISCDTVILPYSDAEITYMSASKFDRVMSRLDLQPDASVICPFNNLRLYDYLVRNSYFMANRSEVMTDIIDILIKKIAARRRLDLVNDAVGVYSEKFTEVTEKLILNIVMICNNISLFTNDTDRAELFAEYVCDEKGAVISVSSGKDCLNDKKIVCIVGEYGGTVPGNTIFIDVENANGFGISDAEFRIKNRLGEIKELVNRDINADILAFLLEAGAELKFGRDIELINYTAPCQRVLPYSRLPRRRNKCVNYKYKKEKIL